MRDQRSTHSEAKILYEKIEHKAYGDDEIVMILTTRCKVQLLATLRYYNDMFGHPITKAVDWDALPLACASAGRIGWAWAHRVRPALHRQRATTTTNNKGVPNRC